MHEFICDNLPIQASRKRVVSLAFADVDRVENSQKRMFTGSAVLVTVYTLAAHYQYHLVLFSLDNRVSEIWHVQPAEVSLLESSRFEAGLFADLHRRGIILSIIQPESPNFSTLLTRLPMAFNDENATSPAGLFAEPNSAGHCDDKLSQSDRKVLSDLFAHF